MSIESQAGESLNRILLYQQKGTANVHDGARAHGESADGRITHSCTAAVTAGHDRGDARPGQPPCYTQKRVEKAAKGL